jgi:hypothetical protein
MAGEHQARKEDGVREEAWESWISMRRTLPKKAGDCRSDEGRIRKGASKSMTGKGTGVCEGDRSLGYLTQREAPGFELKKKKNKQNLFGLKKEKVWESEAMGSSLGFLRKEEGPGVQTKSTRY